MSQECEAATKNKNQNSLLDALKEEPKNMVGKWYYIG